MKNGKILVKDGAGFIGSTLVKRLFSDGADVLLLITCGVEALRAIVDP
jgi:nucleoside-diphosphate-sugar epimerase